MGKKQTQLDEISKQKDALSDILNQIENNKQIENIKENTQELQTLLGELINRQNKLLDTLKQNGITEQQQQLILALLKQDKTQEIINLLKQDKQQAILDILNQDKPQEILNILNKNKNNQDQINGLIINEAVDILKKSYELKKNEQQKDKSRCKVGKWLWLLLSHGFFVWWMLRMPYRLYLLAENHNYWICDNKPNNVALISVLATGTIIYLTVLSVSGYICKNSRNYYKKQALEQELKEEYEPKLRKLLFYKKYRDQYGDEVVKNIINKLYPTNE